MWSRNCSFSAYWEFLGILCNFVIYKGRSRKGAWGSLLATRCLKRVPDIPVQSTFKQFPTQTSVGPGLKQNRVFTSASNKNFARTFFLITLPICKKIRRTWFKINSLEACDQEIAAFPLTENFLEYYATSWYTKDEVEKGPGAVYWRLGVSNVCPIFRFKAHSNSSRRKPLSGRG